MNISDSIQRFMFEDQPTRGEIVHLTASYQEILAQHPYPDSVKKLLGETLTASVLLAASIKFKGTLTIQFHGDGVIKMLVAKCDDAFNLRGLAKFDEVVDDENQFKQCFGKGKLVITIAAENTTQSYQSIVPINGLSISQCLENYFVQSEQLLTKIHLAANTETAAGVMLQLMPTLKAEEREQFNTSAAELNNESFITDVMEMPNEHFLKALYPHDDIRLFESESVVFKCTCTINKMRDAIKVLGKEEADTIFITQKLIEVCCDYCNHKYEFDSNEVLDIFKETALTKD